MLQLKNKKAPVSHLPQQAQLFFQRDLAPFFNSLGLAGGVPSEMFVHHSFICVRNFF
jgi:hypothetical protein